MHYMTITLLALFLIYKFKTKIIKCHLITQHINYVLQGQFILDICTSRIMLLIDFFIFYIIIDMFVV